MSGIDDPTARDGARPLDDLADAYLDGDLSREEALAFERDLALRPEVAEALSSALALRELLAGLPPLAPPPGLSARIARALPLGREREARGAAERAPSAAGSALAGAAWLLRVPAMAAQGATASAFTAGAGLAQVRWALGPLAAQAAPALRPRRPLWRRLLLGRAR
jgi:anti-sigma factor RsiW